MAIITVTTLDETRRVAPDGEVSLREALLAANTDTSVDGSTAGSGADTIGSMPSLADGALFLDQGQLDDHQRRHDRRRHERRRQGGHHDRARRRLARVPRVGRDLDNREPGDDRRGNAASGGGVLIAAGALTLVNSTVADNQATGNGGGLTTRPAPLR